MFSCNDGVLVFQSYCPKVKEYSCNADVLVFQSYCLKVKELDDEEYSYAALQEPLYRVETGNYEYRYSQLLLQSLRTSVGQVVFLPPLPLDPPPNSENSLLISLDFQRDKLSFLVFPSPPTHTHTHILPLHPHPPNTHTRTLWNAWKSEHLVQCFL